MAKIGPIELTTQELAQMGKNAFEALGPEARSHDVPHIVNDRTSRAKADADFAEMAHGVIAAYLARVADMPAASSEIIDAETVPIAAKATTKRATKAKALPKGSEE